MSRKITKLEAKKQFEKYKNENISLRNLTRDKSYSYVALKNAFDRLNLPIKKYEKFTRSGEWRNQGKFQKRAKNESCLICGEDRLTEVCHIESRKDGGKYLEENILFLCPLHHKLFDRNMLNQNEKKILEKYLRN